LIVGKLLLDLFGGGRSGDVDVKPGSIRAVAGAVGERLHVVAGFEPVREPVTGLQRERLELKMVRIGDGLPQRRSFVQSRGLRKRMSALLKPEDDRAQQEVGIPGSKQQGDDGVRGPLDVADRLQQLDLRRLVRPDLDRVERRFRIGLAGRIATLDPVIRRIGAVRADPQLPLG
jgi:hypothetical protein